MARTHSYSGRNSGGWLQSKFSGPLIGLACASVAGLGIVVFDKVTQDTPSEPVTALILNENMSIENKIKRLAPIFEAEIVVYQQRSAVLRDEMDWVWSNEGGPTDLAALKTLQYDISGEYWNAKDLSDEGFKEIDRWYSAAEQMEDSDRYRIEGLITDFVFDYWIDWKKANRDFRDDLTTIITAIDSRIEKASAPSVSVSSPGP